MNLVFKDYGHGMIWLCFQLAFLLLFVKRMIYMLDRNQETQMFLVEPTNALSLYTSDFTGKEQS